MAIESVNTVCSEERMCIHFRQPYDFDSLIDIHFIITLQRVVEYIQITAVFHIRYKALSYNFYVFKGAENLFSNSASDYEQCDPT